VNTVTPPPNQFTHELTVSQPFHYKPGRGRSDGVLAAGTRVVLMARDGGSHCWVVDGRGLYVRTACAGLQPL
jgi:hypothetical protein